MEKNTTISAELQTKMVTTFKNRMGGFGIKPKSKRYLDSQAEFFTGVCVAIDALLKNEKSCVPPNWYVSILRGEVID